MCLKSKSKSNSEWNEFAKRYIISSGEEVLNDWNKEKKKMLEEINEMIEILKETKSHIDYIDCNCRECGIISNKIKELFEKRLENETQINGGKK